MANTKSTVNVQIDADVEYLAEQILSHMGIDQTTAIEMFYRQIIKERGLPFRPSAGEPSLEERIVTAALKRNPKRVSLPSDAEGNVIIDKNKHPDIYEWAVEG